MADPPNSLDIKVEGWLNDLGILLLADWDVLVFLYRHQTSLANAEQIARLVGYASTVVADALANLESLKLVQRSRASQGVRMYQFVLLEDDFSPGSGFRQLMDLGENRTGRLLISKKLRTRRHLRLAVKGKAAWLKKA